VEALPLAGTFLLTLLAHEAGHRVAAGRRGVSLYLPLLVPAGFGFLGSFGGITRFRGFVPDRATLLDVAAAGPAAGTAASGALLLAGLGLSAAGLGDVTVDSASFADSWSVALLVQAALGDALANPEVGGGAAAGRPAEAPRLRRCCAAVEPRAAPAPGATPSGCWRADAPAPWGKGALLAGGGCAGGLGKPPHCLPASHSIGPRSRTPPYTAHQVRVSSLLIAGWAGLVVNALNCLPAGELDGGRISLALFGRRCAASAAVTARLQRHDPRQPLGAALL
jgi:membrane-associated protease RseP (regulator of RpoE activity)